MVVHLIEAVRGFGTRASPLCANCLAVVGQFSKANRDVARPNQCRFTHKAPPKVV